MPAAENRALVSRIRRIFFSEKNVRAICKAATSRDGKGLSIVQAHSEPLKHGFAAMFRDTDERGGGGAGYYPTHATTRDAFQLAEMLAIIHGRLSEAEIKCIKDAFNRDSARGEDFSSTALEIWVYAVFTNPANLVRFNDEDVGWDVEVKHNGESFTFQCKSVRYGLGRLPTSDARAFENLLHLLRSQAVDPSARKLFLGFEIFDLDSLKRPGTAKMVADYIAAKCRGEPADDKAVVNACRLVAQGSSLFETGEQFRTRFSAVTSESLRRPEWPLPVHSFHAANQPREAGAIEFALPLGIEALAERCAKRFDEAMDGLRGRPNAVPVIGIEASMVKLREGDSSDRAKLGRAMQSLSAEIWAEITRKTQWPNCFGCFLLFKMPSWTLLYPGQGRATSFPLHLAWQDPEGGSRRSKLPPINTMFRLG